MNGLWIDKWILELSDPNIKPVHMMLLAQISNFHKNKKTLIKLNKELAKELKVSVKSITRALELMYNSGLIVISYTKEGFQGREVTLSKRAISMKCPSQNDQAPGQNDQGKRDDTLVKMTKPLVKMTKGVGQNDQAPGQNDQGKRDDTLVKMTKPLVKMTKGVGQNDQAPGQNDQAYKVNKVNIKVKKINNRGDFSFSNFSNPLKEENKSTPPSSAAPPSPREQAVEAVNYLSELVGHPICADLNSENVKYALQLLYQNFTLEDLKTMIEYKVYEWKDNPAMAPYLKPVTIFQRHGKRYIEESKVAKQSKVIQAKMKQAKNNQAKKGGFVPGPRTLQAIENIKNW